MSTDKKEFIEKLGEVDICLKDDSKGNYDGQDQAELKEEENTDDPFSQEESIGDLSPQEEMQLKALRLVRKKRRKCAEEIDKILKEYNAVLSIDRQSPFGSPQIIVQLRE